MKVVQLSEKDRFNSSSTSKGNQMKWCVRTSKGRLVYLKADKFGYESISEALVSDFLHFVEDINFVDYYLCGIKEILGNGDIDYYYGCYSYDMLKPGEQLVSIYRLLQSGDDNFALNWKKLSNEDSLNYILGIIRKVTKCDIYDYLRKIIYLDAIIYNEDRHLNNISLIFDTNTSIFRPAPIFDNGLSLLSDIDNYPMSRSVEKNLSFVKSRPICSSFLDQVNLFDYKPLKIHFTAFLERFDSYIPEFKERELDRAREVLLKSLVKWEGRLWERV